ncbi:uncharacterized acetyltransferase At3g50280-like [Mercurialis annua]|uniref:uncharacterized acetyltransferase At3g50280-like n=1 Tax=Mercurialis annua TaxID=3986 RepID=UPI00215F7B57|nr:uncharacterized acetyltransferase At3g50280-like [Mercurialis annua]
MNPQSVQHISECFVKPQPMPHEANQPFYLTQWDLAMLSVHYIQKGLLFSKPSPNAFNITNFLDKLKHSLAQTLIYFYPLAGRLVTTKGDDPASYAVYVDCTNSPGARFVHASVEMTLSDVLSPTYVPSIVQSFFDHDRALNHDGHFKSLLTIQVTDLIDGVFIGCSLNHAIGDGSSFWQFLNSFSEIFRAAEGDDVKISRPPVLKRWFPDGYGPVINLPFTNPEQFLLHYESPLLKERMFHFSSASIAKLKAKANSEHNTNKISSFQSLSALMWRCITRTRNLPHDQITSCRVACNNRSRLNPPLPENYFGNCIYPLRAFTIAGELLENNLGWAAWKVHEAVVNHTDEATRKNVESWMKSPTIYKIPQLFDSFSVMMGSSPRFNKYGSEFGLGKALALRSGYAHKFSGKVSAYPGREGGGSMDLEICMPPDLMDALESDPEFMDAL